jgi:hypothetical protein
MKWLRKLLIKRRLEKIQKAKLARIAAGKSLSQKGR